MRAVVHLIVEFAVVELAEQAADRLLGVGEDVAHVGGNDVRPVIARRLHEAFRPARTGGELRLEVRDVAIRIARRPLARAEQRTHLRLAKTLLVDQQFIVDQHAFLIDADAVGRHRSRRDSADVGVMPACRDEGGRLGFVAIEERHDHCDVGQMGAAAVRIV